MSMPTFFARSKLLLFRSPLRGDPRFEEIVVSLAPKDATSTK
jgi:hypothetical protein